MSYKSFTFGLLGIALGAFTTGALQVVVAWKAPNQQAPLDNVDAPINVGATAQKKNADLSVVSLYAGGVVAAPELCIGSDCRKAWPTGGVSSITGGTCATGKVVQSISSTGAVTCITNVVSSSAATPAPAPTPTPAPAPAPAPKPVNPGSYEKYLCTQGNSSGIIISSGTGCRIANPATGACSCPNGTTPVVAGDFNAPQNPALGPCPQFYYELKGMIKYSCF